LASLLKSIKLRILLSIILLPISLVIVLLVNNLWLTAIQLRKEANHSLLERSKSLEKTVELYMEAFRERSIRIATDVQFVVPLFYRVKFQAHEYLRSIELDEKLADVIVVDREGNPIVSSKSDSSFAGEVQYYKANHELQLETYFRVIADKIFIVAVVPVKYRNSILGFVVVTKPFELDKRFHEALLFKETELQSVAPGSEKLNSLWNPAEMQSTELGETAEFGNYYVGSVPVVGRNSEIVGKLVFGVDFSERERTQKTSAKILFLVILPLGAVVLLVGRALGNNISQPILQLAENSRYIAEHKFSELKWFHGRNDEIGFLSQNLEQMVKSLQRVENLKDEFLANTSHELRTPLNGILGIAESMLEGSSGPLSVKQYNNLNWIVLSGRRLANLVNDILDFSKLRHRSIELQLKPTSIREIVDVVLALSQPLLGKKDVTLVNSIPTTVSLVDADENRVQQILFNLIGNSIKFTESGTIEVSAREILGLLEISVSDTGIGIPQEKLSDIFKPFEQGDGSTGRLYGGTGIGLTITKQLIELHSGVVRVSSRVGEGSTFVFTLPISQEITVPTITLQEKARPEHRMMEVERLENFGQMILEKYYEPGIYEGQEKRKRLTLLAVDDEPINLQVIENLLSHEKWDLVTVESGIEALEFIAASGVPDIMLLDVMMPRMTGFALCAQLREIYSIHELPIIFLTAKNQSSDILEGFVSGANDYVTKPFSKKELVARITTHARLLGYGRELSEAKARTETLLECTKKMAGCHESCSVLLHAVQAIYKNALKQSDYGCTLFFQNEPVQKSETRSEEFIYSQLKFDLKPSEVSAILSEHFLTRINDVRIYNAASHPDILEAIKKPGITLKNDLLRISVVKQGKLIALIEFSGIDEVDLTPEVQTFLETLTSSLAISLENISYITETEEKTRLESEMNAAKAVQEGLLPRNLNFPGVEIIPLYCSADKTGGDWYGCYHNTKSDTLLIALGDVIGHGVSSALVTGVACGATYAIQKCLALQEAKLDPESSLLEMAHVLNQIIRETGNGSTKSMTMCFISIHLPTGKVSHLSAGHPWPLWYHQRTGAVQAVLNSGSSLGSGEPNFKVLSFELEPGDHLFLYTDGLIESEGPQGETLSLKRVKQIVAHRDIQVVQTRIHEVAQRTWNGIRPPDDVTTLAVRWTGHAVTL
jgi:signal transduction histidine kinase/CheY-like chemotaxis protein/serine phosphatase RsbU (regulator of sigma subunit)